MLSLPISYAVVEDASSNQAVLTLFILGESPASFCIQEKTNVIYLLC